jgi:DNA-binding transcriptional LysR family regulator
MDWDKLKTFHFAAETGSLTAAAEKLGVSQSSVSRQIAALESGMGVPLFQRHARGLLLTGPGMALREFTREMANAAIIAESTLKDAREKVIGDLKVTAPVAFGSTWLAPRLVHFADVYPETRLQILLDDREYDLLKLEAECAIRLWAATHADLIQRKLLEVHVSLYASPSYLAQHGIGGQVSIHRPRDCVRHHQGRRGQVVRANLLLNSPLEIAVARQNGAHHESMLADLLGHLVRQRPAVADTGRAAVAHHVEPQPIE